MPRPLAFGVYVLLHSVRARENPETVFISWACL
jgi:hypothetical protein